MQKPKTILCLDDEVLGLTVRKAVLEQKGYVVLTATSAEEALQQVSTQQIDLVITDHFLNGILGTQVATTLKERKPQIPILILSGSVELPDHPSHADAFLSKLEPPQVLFAVVANLLRGENRERKAS
jgi:CheY-like chemotaxis protein